MLKEVEIQADRYQKISETPQMSVIEIPVSPDKRYTCTTWRKGCNEGIATNARGSIGERREQRFICKGRWP